MEIKEQFLSAITIYRMNGEGMCAYQLRYEACSLSRFPFRCETPGPGGDALVRA
ncbi:hypothetical protein ACIBO4_18045 [Streptomyces sp. NPDC050149]|uniref:hypothetical protein n=1 Tax=Streptomyces sp. NPDC050149 TaxID=3365603 RepID=UPI0037BC9EC5